MRHILIIMTSLTLVLTACGGADAPDLTDVPDATDTTDEPTAADEPADEPTATDEPTADDPDATEEPGANGEEAVAGDCSAAGLDDTVEGDAVSEGARTTAAFLLDAAVRCDEQLLFTAATESDTTFFFGSATVDEVFALPEDPDADPSAWEALARLLGSTTPVIGDGDIWTWPAAAAPGADDDAWQELVDSGLYTQAQVDELRSAGEGYLGWRVGIEAGGDWLFMTAGD